MTWLPIEMMSSEDDQLLTWLHDHTMQECGLNGPCCIMADILDPQDAGIEDIRDLNEAEMEVLLHYAKVGRNAFLRHVDSLRQEQTDE